MNTKKHRSKRIVVLMCLVVALLTCQVLQPMVASAVDETPVTVSVSFLPDLLDAIDNAADGDVIGLSGKFVIPSDTVIGHPNKHITLKRLYSTTYLQVETASNVKFQNVTLDGNSIKTEYPLVRSIQSSLFSITFEDVMFENCSSINAGAAVTIFNGTALFKNCMFTNNSAMYGGHMSIAGNSNVDIENCIFTDGDAVGNGGAIYISTPGATCNIKSSVITQNKANLVGGGIATNGIITIENTKLFNNTASKGGSDTAIIFDGQLNLVDSLEELQALFSDYEFNPVGWVYDYEEGAEIHGVDTSREDNLLKLAFEERILLPTAVVLDEASLGAADSEKITGLESGKYYKVTAGEVVSYSKADGTLTITESEASPLVGTEITGLTNGETYLIEEFTPAPTTVLLDSASLGTADNEKVIGLAAGKMYKVSIDGTTNYTKADGTLTINADEAEALTGTEIVGLTNGETYLVEEYTPPTPEPEPEEPIEEPVDDPDPSDEPTPDPTETPDPSPTPDPEPIDDDQEEPTPTPKPSTNHNSGSSHSSHTVVTAPKAVVLSSGKAVLDTTKTEYLLGYSDGLLGNQSTVTRSQFAQIVYRLLTPESLEDVYSEKNTFKDVASDDWYNEAVSTLANTGLISVGTDKLFNPDKNITWGEMCSILSKFAEPNSEWKIITRHWAKDEINTAISYRWFEYNDQFNPDGEVTRLQMLKFINTLFEWTAKK